MASTAAEQVAAHHGQVPRLGPHRSGAQRQAEVGGGQRRGVVDPSPTMATDASLALQPAHHAGLVVRAAPRRAPPPASMPTWSASTRAAAPSSPVSRIGVSPSARSRRTACRAVRPDRVADRDHRASDPVPGHRRPRCARPPRRVARARDQLGGQLDVELGEQRRPPDQHRVRDHRVRPRARRPRRARPSPGVLSNSATPGSCVRAGCGHRGRRDRRPPGVRRPARPRRPAAAPGPGRRPSAGCTPCTVITPVVSVPVRSSSTVSTARVDSSTSGPLIRMPELGAAAGAGQQRGRGGQTERARAGDEQHRDGGGDRVRRPRRRRPSQ